MSETTSMSAYLPYVAHLKELASRAASGDTYSDAALDAALDGGAASALRGLVPRELRRSAGAYFTGEAVRQRLVPLLERYGASPYFDPACGAGDLLLMAASQLRVGSSTAATVHAWASQLAGTDLEPAFVEAARSRVILAAVSRSGGLAGPSPTDRPSQCLLTGLQIGDARDVASWPTNAPRTILLNPPYGSEPAPRHCSWGSGRVPRAALFVDLVVEQMATDSTLIAVLPDVLRSGSRLSRWRQQVKNSLDIQHVERVGRFDAHTDVDVFLLVGRKRGDVNGAILQPLASQATWWSEGRPEDTVGHRFAVRVGPVVHNRDAHDGPLVPYAFARGLPRAGRATIVDTRAFAGRLCSPPFVLVRRTSAPSGGGVRPSPVLVADGPNVAVDNHLIVLSPRGGTVTECEQLAKVLEQSGATTYLDQRIRCRHLTVGAVSSIPWRNGDENQL